MEKISLREFARRLNVDVKIIQRAIANNKINEGHIIEDGKKKIIYEIALKECEAFGIGDRKKAKVVEQVEKVRKEYTHKERQPLVISDGIGGLTKTSTYADALRLEKIYKAQIACLDSEEKNRVLVNRDEVYATLFDFGNQVKSKMLNIADRITDDLIALSNDRDAFYSLLSKSIEDELQILSEIE